MGNCTNSDSFFKNNLSVDFCYFCNYFNNEFKPKGASYDKNKK